MGCITNPKLFLLSFQLPPNYRQEKEQNEDPGGHRPENTRCRMAHALQRRGFHWHLSQKAGRVEKNKSNCLNRIWPISLLIYLSVPRNYLCGAQSSPFRKFTDTPEGVGHRHKLPKLVEESNILIFAISETHRPSRSQQSCVIVTQTTEFGRDWAAI